jgi:hypothetical protein
MNNKTLAAHLGLSPHTTKKFSPEKRQQAISDINAGVDPIVSGLVGELATACYRASHYSKTSVAPEFYVRDDITSHFSVFVYDYANDNGCHIVSADEQTPDNLRAAIAKVLELCK